MVQVRIPTGLFRMEEALASFPYDKSPPPKKWVVYNWRLVVASPPVVLYCGHELNFPYSMLHNHGQLLTSGEKQQAYRRANPLLNPLDRLSH